MERKPLFEARDYNNIKEIIYDTVRKYGDRDVFVIKHKDENNNVSYENITFNKMLEDINGLGTELYSIGLKGKRVAIIGKNRYEWVLTHFACQLGGIVSVPLDKDLQVDELENSLINWARSFR